MSLIARFCFKDIPNPIDVRIPQDEKERFLQCLKEGKPYHDEEGPGSFWANMETVSCYFIQKETPKEQETKEDSKD